MYLSSLLARRGGHDRALMDYRVFSLFSRVRSRPLSTRVCGTAGLSHSPSVLRIFPTTPFFLNIPSRSR